MRREINFNTEKNCCFCRCNADTTASDNAPSIRADVFLPQRC